MKCLNVVSVLLVVLCIALLTDGFTSPPATPRHLLLHRRQQPHPRRRDTIHPEFQIRILFEKDQAEDRNRIQRRLETWVGPEMIHYNSAARVKTIFEKRKYDEKYEK